MNVTRRSITFAILGLWLAGLALLYRRSTSQSPEQSLVEAGMRVSPATYYYRVDQGGAQVGAASSAIDTTTAQLTATDFVRAAIPAGRDTFRMQARSQAHFSRGLSLRDFILKVEGDLPAFLLRGVMRGEGKERTLQLTTEMPKRRPTAKEYDIAGLLFVPTVAPLPVMLNKMRKPGASLPIGIFDPMSRAIRNVNLKIERDSLFSVTDSAARDSATGLWVSAHADTIRGWLISGDVPTIIAWVDESGRMIAASEPGGISLSRTSFEIAFENWRLEGVAADSAAKAKRLPQSPSRLRRK